MSGHSAQGPPPARRDRSRPLSREKIAAVTLEVVREEGPAAASMRRVAAEFEVDPAALYRHFESKDDLLRKVAQMASESVVLWFPVAGSWDERAAELCRSIRNGLREHPELSYYGGGSTWSTPFLARANGLLTIILFEGGLRGRELVLAAQTLLHVVNSAAHSEVLNRATSKEDNRAFGRAILEHLPAELRSAWSTLGGTRHHFDDFFEFALAAALRGIAARIDGDRASP